jgi:ACS family hexuronate transporter-like MFS transporter
VKRIARRSHDGITRVDPSMRRCARVSGQGQVEATETAPELPSSVAWLVTLVATSTMAISYLDRQVLAVLAPTVTAELAIGDEQYGWLQSAFSIAYLACSPFAGRMLERVGIRKGLLAAVLVWTLVSAGHALAMSFAMLFALRLLLGAAESPSFPGAAGTIARTQPAPSRARAIGVLFTGSSIGAMVAPILAPYLMTRLGGFQGAFVGVAVVGLAWVPIWWLVTSSRGVPERLDAAPPRANAPSLIGILREPAVRRACLLVLATSPLFAFVLLWGAKLLHDGLGVPQAEVGHYLWLPPVLFDLGAITFGHFASVHARKHGPASTPTGLVIVAALLATSLGGLALATTPWQVAIVAGVAMAGGAGLFAMVTAEMIRGVGPSVAATAGGATASAQSLMYVIANPAIGRGVETFHDYGPVALVIASLVLPGALLWLWLRPRPSA